MNEEFSGVWTKGNSLYTRNLVEGEQVYGEKLSTFRGDEFD